jgi:hypothetical protein
MLTSGIIPNGNAANFGIGINPNEEIVWICKVCNTAELDSIFGSDWDGSGIFINLSQGARMKWKINSTEVNSTTFSVKYDIWYWNFSDEWGIKDDSSQINFYINPDDYFVDYSFLNYSSLVPFLLPIPVGDYLGDLSAKLNYWYDVDNRVLTTLNVYIPKDGILPGYPYKDIKIIAIYNDRGILNTYKLYGKENRVIIDIALDFLPVYVFPSLIGLISGLSLGTILYFVKKRKSVKK